MQNDLQNREAENDQDADKKKIAIEQASKGDKEKGVIPDNPVEPTGPKFSQGFKHTSMTCPNCGSINIKVVKTDPITETVIKRNFICRREKCGARFHTLQDMPIIDQIDDKLAKQEK